jgi:short-subunit dehydrogenase
MPPLRALLIGNTDGIGRALTTRLLTSGYRVTGISRRASTLVHDAYDHVVCDVSSEAYPGRLAALLSERPPFDVCIYCVGIGDLLDPDDLTQEAQVFRVNLLGLVHTTSAVLPALVAAGGGHFVGLSSIGDATLSAEAPGYAASKAGVSSYLAGLHLAFRSRGIHVSNVRLGFVDTKMAKSKVRPLMISCERAVDLVMRCLHRRPARLTHPWLMDAVVHVLRWLTLVRLALRS